MKWLILYENGETFCDQDGAWADAPSDGVLYVLVKKGDVIQTLSGSDHYILLDDETVATTDDLGSLLRKWGVKFGRWTTHKRFEEIGRRAADTAAKWPR